LVGGSSYVEKVKAGGDLAATLIFNRCPEFSLPRKQMMLDACRMLTTVAHSIKMFVAWHLKTWGSVGTGFVSEKQVEIHNKGNNIGSAEETDAM
jgi:hypothetical protein